MAILLIILAVVAVIVFYVIMTYNNLVSTRTNVEASWSQIDVQLQRRFDLIPNLVNTVKGYMKHESSVLEKVTELRTQWQKATTVASKDQLSNELSSSLKTIMAVSENYPDLKSSTNFTQLSEELTTTENKIAFARQNYNGLVAHYNAMLQRFPTNIIANMFNFKKADLLQANEEERKNVKVEF